jgi:hypothetical protein
VCHRQHCDDRDYKNGEREDGAANDKAALMFGHGDVSYDWPGMRGGRAESGFVMINGRFSHLQMARSAFAAISVGAIPGAEAQGLCGTSDSRYLADRQFGRLNNARRCFIRSNYGPFVC